MVQEKKPYPGATGCTIKGTRQVSIKKGGARLGCSKGRGNRKSHAPSKGLLHGRRRGTTTPSKKVSGGTDGKPGPAGQGKKLIKVSLDEMKLRGRRGTREKGYARKG